MKTLRRMGKLGNYVLYPKDVDSRYLYPIRSVQTACDMLVGGCSCGRVHSTNDDDTKSWLRCYPNYRIETPEQWKLRLNSTTELSTP